MELEKILAKVGLTIEHTCIGPNFNFWNDAEYKHYTTEEYRSSATAEVDSVYNMYEGHLLHYQSGLRLKMLGTESYFGDTMSYKIISAYILLTDRRMVEIDDIDSKNKFFICGGEKIPFYQTLKN